jgi:hypothetical protein
MPCWPTQWSQGENDSQAVWLEQISATHTVEAESKLDASTFLGAIQVLWKLTKN